LWTICSGWLWTAILPISVSWQANTSITGVSHWPPGFSFLFFCGMEGLNSELEPCLHPYCYFFVPVPSTDNTHWSLNKFMLTSLPTLLEITKLG
jgi:hypothetical protein